VRGDRLFVADQNNHRVQRFDLDATGGPTGAPVAFGSLGTGPGQLDHPEGLAVSADGRHVFVADNRNDRVVRFSDDGAFEQQTGLFGHDDGEFFSPYDVGLDDFGHLYVADNENHRVQQFEASTLAFQRAFGGFGTDPGELGFPRSLAGLAGDPGGGVLVGDTSNNRVEAWDREGRFVRAFGESGRVPGQFTIPGGVAVAPDGSVLVADSVNHRIERLAPDGRFVSEIAKHSSLGYTTPGSGPGEFREPQNVAVAADGAFAVADTGNHRVQRFAADGTWLEAIGGPGAGTAPGTFRAPRGIAVEPDGDLLVGDTGNARVQRRDARTGAWSVVRSGLDKPSGVAPLGGDRIAVTETDGDRLRILDAGGAVEASRALARPDGVAAAADGSVFVSEAGRGRVRRFDPALAEAEAFGDLVSPAGLALDGAGGVWVADRYDNRVRRFAPGAIAAPAVTATPAPIPAAAPTPTPTPTPSAPPAPTAATATPAVRVRAGRLRLSAVRRADRRAPYAFRLRGRLEVTGPARCVGRVRVELRLGKRLLARRTVGLDGRCAYRATLRTRRGGRLRASARFFGATPLLPRTARPIGLRAGR